MQHTDDPDEQPVIYRTPHIPLLPTAQSPRAPWLHTAAMTSAKFKQPSIFQTEKALQQLSCHQVHSYISTHAVHVVLFALSPCKLC